eukprot:NODE_6201_length_595_cov_17.608059_g5792_i0.p1 GENE.NODE_6201_length_595_cov_17.608059_g5792_i0~~NODE_6201_length_595_cov_17.608059_g5792_i0.p1  ORF type:complete len:170 (+),score=25.22 NODE_6201_length_595_cov_17.608059_g5792_i0:43-510(+)
MPMDPRTYEQWYNTWRRGGPNGGGSGFVGGYSPVVGYGAASTYPGNYSQSAPGPMRTQRMPIPVAGRGGGGGSGRKVFFGNLPFNTQWQDLKDVIKAAGFLGIKVDMNVDASGKPRGSALVTFDDPREAVAAIERLHDQPFNGRLMDVHFDKFAS